MANYKIEKMVSELSESSEPPNYRQIKALMEKAVNLGFTLEAIQEGLKRIFKSLNLDLNAFLTSQTAFDLSKLFDEEKFIELLITVSLQMDNPNTNSFKSNNGSEFDNEVDTLDDMDDDYMTTAMHSNVGGAPGMSFFNDNNSDVVNGGNEPSELNNTSILNKMGFSKPQQLQQHIQQQQQRIFESQNKKAQTIQKRQQEQQEYYIQSMNRINDKSNLRPIIVDSNDVALSSNANKQVFQFQRILKVVEYFEKRNHPIYVILSSWRKEQIMSTVLASSSSNGSAQQTNNNGQSSPAGSPSASQPALGTVLTPDQLALLELEKKNQVYYTPSKRVGTKRIVCDDDSYMLKLAVAKNGIIVSNDNFKRFLNHSEDFKLVIEERVLMYSFIDDTFMPAEDPLGKNGPSLDNFLRFESFANQQFMKRCPYRKKCTYGSKCKFWHPERALNQGGAQFFKSAHQSVIEGVQEQRTKLDALLKQHQLPTQFFAPSQSNLDHSGLTKTISSHMPQSLANSTEMSRFDPSQIIRKMGIDNSGVIGKSTVAANLKNNVNIQLMRQQQQQQQLKPNLGDMFFGNKPKLANGLANFLWTDENENSFSSVSGLLDNENNFSSISKPQSAAKNLQTQQAALSGFLMEKKMDDLSLKPKPASSADLKPQLMLKLKNAELVDKVLKDYPNESDVEKLSFIAGAYSFEF